MADEDFVTEIFTRMNSKTCSTVKSFYDSCQVHIQWLEDLHKSLLDIENHDRPLLPRTPVPKSKKRPAALSSSEEEGVISRQMLDIDSSLNYSGKPQRNASKMASLKINEQTHMKLNTKMRRPGSLNKENQQDNISDPKSIIAVKIEKDVEPTTEAPKQALTDAIKENMPPPIYKPKRGRKKIKSEIRESADSETESGRSSRSRQPVKKEQPDDKRTEPKLPVELPVKPVRSARNQPRPDSDVVIQEVPIPVYTISDDEADNAQAAPENSKQVEATGYASSALSEAESNADELTDKPTDTEDEEPTKKGRGKKKKGKAVKGASKKADEKKKVQSAAEDKSIYEDAISVAQPDAKPKKRDSKKDPQQQQDNGIHRDKVHEKPTTIPSKENVQPSSSNMNCTVTIEKCTEVPSAMSGLNSTQVIQKEIASLLSPGTNQTELNSTHVIEKAKQSPRTQQLLKDTGINFNCTVVLDKMNTTTTLHTAGPMNKTVVLSPKDKVYGWQKKENAVLPVPDNLLTDDDDDSIEVSSKKKTPAKKPDAKKAAKTKPMFSPYANSPVKKRVAAFEQLGTGTSDMPVRVTRTKTKMLAEKENELVKEEPATNRLKSKYVTPLMSKKIPSLVPHTDSKQYRTYAANKMYNTSVMSGGDMPVKSATAVKPSKADLLEQRRADEQRRREEKEAEVRRKKEALLQARIEEQKRKREEKQLKAQKAREQLDREKEEKLKQMMQKEEKMLEEQQRKREWAVKRIAELEERKRMEEQIKVAKAREHEAKKKQEQELRKAKYDVKPPPLPTEDGEDSDSSAENAKPMSMGPIWGQKKQLIPHLLKIRHVPRDLIDTFFQVQATTPDLREIFESVDERMLRRNSSAVWRTPPRYSTLPKF